MGVLLQGTISFPSAVGYQDLGPESVFCVSCSSTRHTKPREVNMSISSMTSRLLVINALGVNDRVPLLESGDAAGSKVSDSSGMATKDFPTERFVRLAANESAAILLVGRHVSGMQKLLTDDLSVECGASTGAPACSASSLTNSSIGDITMPSLPVGCIARDLHP